MKAGWVKRNDEESPAMVEGHIKAKRWGVKNAGARNDRVGREGGRSGEGNCLDNRSVKGAVSPYRGRKKATGTNMQEKKNAYN